MRILIFNWRDVKNPQSGGAEILTHEMAKRWAASGNAVTQVSELYKGAKVYEIVDGVEIFRCGSAEFRSLHTRPIHLTAYWWYQKYKNSKFDVVIDEIHGIPFFTPLYVKENKVALICEVAHEIWDVMFQFPLNIIGKTIENNYFRFYKDIPFLTISKSTKNDLIAMGIKENNITVLPMGFNHPKLTKQFPKEKAPTLIFVGRLSQTKGIDDAITAFSQIKRIHQNAKLWIIGRGDRQYEENLKTHCRQLDIEDSVTFFGFVTEQKKFELMGRAHMLLAPSIKEGWGLIVTEASYVGTPAIVYNVGGLKDIITNKVNGLVVEKSTDAIVHAAVELLTNHDLYRKVQMGAIAFAKKQSWDRTAEVGLELLKKTTGI